MCVIDLGDWELMVPLDPYSSILIGIPKRSLKSETVELVELSRMHFETLQRENSSQRERQNRKSCGRSPIMLY